MNNLFECKECGHIAFNKAPGKCPVCGAPQASFSQNSEAIMPSAKEGKEKHVPVIDVMAGCGLLDHCRDVNIKVGTNAHPMMENHWINWMDLYVNKTYIARYTLTPQSMQPALGIHLKNDVKGKLTVIEFCNMHGKWMAETELL